MFVSLESDNEVTYSLETDNFLDQPRDLGINLFFAGLFFYCE